MIKRQCVRLSKLSIKPSKRSKGLSARQSKNSGFVATIFKGKPEVYEELRKCATVALRDYNLKMHTNYELLDINDAHSGLVFGILRDITFQASDSDNGLETFEAVVFTKNNREKGEMLMSVKSFRIKKPESIRYTGSLTEVVPIL